MNVETVEVRKLTPSEGMHLQNIHTGEVYEDFIFMPKSLTKADYREITEEEYQAILAEQETESEE